MKNIKLYKNILLVELSLIITMLAHIIATLQRGYKVIGGEFLVIPLLYILYKAGQALVLRVKETNEHFRKKEEMQEWQEQRKFSC